MAGNTELHVRLGFQGRNIILQNCLAVFADLSTIKVEMRILECDKYPDNLWLGIGGKFPVMLACQLVAGQITRAGGNRGSIILAFFQLLRRSEACCCGNSGHFAGNRGCALFYSKCCIIECCWVHVLTEGNIDVPVDRCSLGAVDR